MSNSPLRCSGMAGVNEGSQFHPPPIHLSTSGTSHRASTSTHWHFAFGAICIYSV